MSSDEKRLYGRSRRCKECKCADPAKLHETTRMDYSPRSGTFLRYEALECERCGSVSPL